MKRVPIPAVALAIALLTVMLGLAACGEKSESVDGEAQPFTLTLDFYPNPDHAGIYMAQKLGYFEEAGLDLTIQTPSDPAAPIKQVGAGRSDLAISYEPEVILAREQGLDV
ncbi:MAG TPA: ABC transporter substrate-binding protein, partial [Solirubrobacterales bacterium]|nr:ABC transporter substrate-binding protein [Solirubrobacterales bacterium]